MQNQGGDVPRKQSRSRWYRFAAVGVVAVALGSGSLPSLRSTAEAVETGLGAGEELVVVHDAVDFGGRGLQIFGDDPDFITNGALGGTGFAVSSIEVYGGMVVAAYSETNFGGTCQTFSGKDADLFDDRIDNDNIRSIKLRTTCAGGEVIDPVVYDVGAAASGDGSVKCPDETVQVDMDANDEVGGDFVWLCQYYRERSAGDYVHDIKVAAYPPHGIYNTSNGTHESGRISQCSGRLVDVDLNQGAGGAYVYLCLYLGSSNTPLRDLELFHPGYLERHGEFNSKTNEESCGDLFVGYWSGSEYKVLDDYGQGDAYGPVLSETTAYRGVSVDQSTWAPDPDLNLNTHFTYDGTISTCLLRFDEPQPPNRRLKLLSWEPAPNAAGWNNGDTTLTYECVSSIVIGIGPDGTEFETATFPVTMTAEGADQRVPAGDCFGEIARERVSIDRTRPGIGNLVQPVPDGTGWHTTLPLDFQWECSDGLSGLVQPTAAQSVTGEGADQTVTGTCTDMAGNTSTDSVTGVNIDTHGPDGRIVSYEPSPTEHVWFGAAVTVTWECLDDVSGPVQSHVSDTISTEGSRKAAAVTCTDVAGNISRFVQLIDVDLTDPEVTIGAEPEANEAGWNNTDVVVSATCADALSGIPGATEESLTVSAETSLAGRIVPATCVDRAGNLETAELTVRLDRTPPTSQLESRYPAPNDHGWNNGPVTVEWSCDDALSGAIKEIVGATVGDEGEDQTAETLCNDLAGNRTIVGEPGIDIDLTPPTAELVSREPAANDDGWNNGAVTVTWACSDALSGVVAETVSATIEGEGEEQTARAVCSDRAGNTKAAELGGINVDLTPPNGELVSRELSPNEDGWNNAAVTVTWACGDALSGVVSETVDAITEGEGAEQTAEAVCEDRAGNSRTVSEDGIDIDLTAPTVDYEGNAGTYGVDDFVAIQCTAADALSGVKRIDCASVEAPAYEYTVGINELSGTATDRADNVGSGSTSFELVLTYDDMCQLSRRFSDSDQLDDQLCRHLAKAKEAEANGNQSQRDGQLQSYRNVIDANTPRNITAEEADVLRGLSSQF